MTTLQNDTLISSSANQYQWFYSNDSLTYSQVAGAIQQIYSVGLTGYYYVQITDSSGCQSVSLPVYINLTSVKSIHSFDGISIRPNPSNDGRFYLKGFKTNITLEWKVYTILGDIVAQSKESKVAVNASQLINISTQPPGVYYLQLKTNSETSTMKLLKQ